MSHHTYKKYKIEAAKQIFGYPGAAIKRHGILVCGLLVVCRLLSTSELTMHYLQHTTRDCEHFCLLARSAHRAVDTTIITCRTHNYLILNCGLYYTMTEGEIKKTKNWSDPLSYETWLVSESPFVFF